MKHFVIEIIYKVPLEKIEELTDAHREYLQTGYKIGLLLVSGPQVPRTGGILIARANSVDEIIQFTKNDPYAINKAAEYRIIEFNPKSRQSFLNDWFLEE